MTERGSALIADIVLSGKASAATNEYCVTK